MIHRKLSEVAPPSASSNKPAPSDSVWHLTLDQIESGSGRVDQRVYGLASDASPSTFVFDEGNVLYSKLRPYLNKVVCPDTNGIATTELVPLRPLPDELNREYLCFYLRSPQFVSWASAQVDGAKMPRMKMKSFWAHEMPVPPIDDQKRIAHLLGKVEGLISQRKQQLQQLDDLLKSVFLEMFGDPVRNEKGWALESLETLIEDGPSNGLYKPQSSYGEGTSIIRIDSFYDGYVQNLNNLKKVQISSLEYARYRIEKDDILVNRVNSIEYLGKIGVVPNADEPMVFESNMMRFRLNKHAILPIFLMFVWRLPFLKAQINRCAKRAVNQASINQKDVMSFVVPLPPLLLQKRFSAIVESADGLRRQFESSLGDLEILYDALSEKAFKGELDLSRVLVSLEDPNTAEAERVAVEEGNEMVDLSFELPAPNNLALLKTADGLKSLVETWLEVWIEQLRDESFSAQDFMERARQRLWAFAEEELLQWGPAEYDEVKTWLFQALEQGRLIQQYDDANNRVQLKLTPP